MTLPVVRKYLEEFNFKYKVRNNILATIHDEIVYELHKESIDETSNKLKEIMENIQGDMLKLYFDCETGGFASLTIADCWKK
jgi:DNA polymerase I-like protein with 3'-5' exonuclease and polymerase domains